VPFFSFRSRRPRERGNPLSHRGSARRHANGMDLPLGGRAAKHLHPSQHETMRRTWETEQARQRRRSRKARYRPVIRSCAAPGRRRTRALACGSGRRRGGPACTGEGPYESRSLAPAVDMSLMFLLVEIVMCDVAETEKGKKMGHERLLKMVGGYDVCSWLLASFRASEISYKK